MNELVKLSQARKYLAEAKDLVEIKQIKDVAKATFAFAKAKGLSKEIQDDAGILVIEAGIEFSKMKKAGQDSGEIRTQATAKSSSKKELDNFGVKKKESYYNDQYAKDEEATFRIIENLKKQDERITEGAVLKGIKIKQRKATVEKQKEDLENNSPKLEGTFDVIVIDPPWSYKREYDPTSSRVANPYPEMAQEELYNLSIPANNNCVMWLWTTHQFIWDAKDLLDYWSFDYKATLIWDKEKIGMGHWLRMQTEFCLLGIKGKPIWDNTTYRDIIREPRREHSRKPDAFYDMVESICYGSKLDYFSRNKRDGWAAFGNDLEKFNVAG